MKNVSLYSFKTSCVQLLLGFESIVHVVCVCKEEVLNVVFLTLRLLVLFHVSFLQLLDRKVVEMLFGCVILKLISCHLLSKLEGN